MKLTNLLITLLFSGFVIASPPPSPGNDACADADPLACGASISASTDNANGTAPGTGCTVSDEGVWYTFTGDGNSTTISVTATSGWDHEINITSGSCGSLTNIACIDNSGFNGTESYTFTTTAAVNYFVYVSYWSSGGGTTGDFDISRTCSAPPVVPLNDECAGAFPITVNPDFSCSSTTAGTVNLATGSIQNTGSCAGTEDTDVWFSFVATNSVHSIDLLNIAGSGTDMYHSVWEGTCPTLTLVAGSCSDPNSSTVTGLTIGNTYYIRVYEYYTGPENTTFDVCVGTPPPPAPCSGDMTITSTLYSQAGLTTCGFVDDYSSSDACGSSYMGGDDIVIEYTPTTSECINIELSNTDTYTGIFITDGCPDDPAASCLANQTSFSGNPILSGFSVTAGTTYFITVSTFPAPQCTAFDLDIVACPPPPANDDCSGAFSVTVNPDLNCGSTTSGTVENSTNSSQSVGACGGTADDDVWFSFVAIGTAHTIELLNISGSVTDMYHSVYSGACPTLTPFGSTCSDPNSQVVTGLTPGQTYYIRVYTFTGTSGQNTTFDVCVGTPPPPPANDDCANAEIVTMSTDGSCNSVSGNVYSATNSGITACGGTANDDVWYTFEATDDTAYVDRIADFDSEIEVFDACSGTSLGCQDGEGTFELTGLTVGDTYLFRIHSWSSTTPSATNSGFTACVFGPSPPPVNVTCSNQQPICSDSPLSFVASSGGADADVIEPGNNYDCLSSSPNPTWYYLDIATDGYLAMDLTAGSDVDFALWGPYNDLTTAKAACGTLPLPIDCSYSASATEEANVTLTTVGEVYILLVTNYADIQQAITLESNTASIATTSCAAVLPVDLINFSGKNEQNKNILTWQTLSELNNDYFIIEKSIDGINYEFIDKILGQGNSSQTQNYTCIDRDYSNNLIYYRLKQVDFDGTEKIIGNIKMTRNSNLISIYPNPTENNISFSIGDLNTDFITIEYISAQGTITYEKIDFNGLNSFKSKIFIDLNKGLYLVRILDENNKVIQIEKVVKI